MSSKHKKNKSKRFDKKNAHRFALMHRSHHDPLFDVPGASKFVLRPQTENPDTEEFLEELQSRVDCTMAGEVQGYQWRTRSRGMAGKVLKYGNVQGYVPHCFRNEESCEA